MDDSEHARVEAALLAKLSLHRGEKLGRQARRDLQWYESRERDRIAEELFVNLPKKTYCELSGRDNRVIIDQAERYNLAISGATVNLYKAIRSFHDFIAESGQYLADDDLRDEKLRKEIAVLERRAAILDGDIRKQKSIYIERAEVHQKLGWLVKKFHQLGERIGKIGGAECQRAVNDMLESIAEELENGHLAIK